MVRRWFSSLLPPPSHGPCYRARRFLPDSGYSIYVGVTLRVMQELLFIAGSAGRNNLPSRRQFLSFKIMSCYVWEKGAVAKNFFFSFGERRRRKWETERGNEEESHRHKKAKTGGRM